MTKFTQKQLREMVANGVAEDVTSGDNDTRKAIENVEGYYTQVGYCLHHLLYRHLSVCMEIGRAHV